VQALVAAGYRVDPTPSSWLTKLWMGNVFLDMIYSSTGPVELDEAMLERGERDLAVTADEHCIHVTGTVSTAARRDAIATVVAQLAPGWNICNDVDLVELSAAPDIEDVPG
jgi:hypothetical protein